MTELHDLALRFGALSSNINPGGLTVHYGGPSPWGAAADRSTPERFAATTDHERCPSIVRAWHAFHLSKGWRGLAYSSAICAHGHRYQGRGVGRRTAANGTDAGNDRSYASCYIAGGDDPLTDGAKLAFADEGARLAGLRWAHRDWKPTACPGGPLWQWRQAGFPLPAPPAVPAPPVMVTPQYDPAVVMVPIVARLIPRDGRGVWLLGRDGSVYAWGDAPYLGGMNGNLHFLYREAARLLHSDDPAIAQDWPGYQPTPGRYVIRATSGEFYAPPFM